MKGRSEDFAIILITNKVYNSPAEYKDSKKEIGHMFKGTGIFRILGAQSNQEFAQLQDYIWYVV